MIDIQDVTYKIAGQPILQDVSLQLDKGGIIALIGPNGAGKSTLLSLVARLLPLQTGTIRVDDLQIGQTVDTVLAKKLGILPQELTVASRLTIRDLVGFGRYPYHKGRPSADDHDRVDTALHLFDLSDLAERQLETLSGGQRQRAFVAMAYVQDTDYLLLDEPLNNLDIAASRALMTLLRDLTAGRKRTVVIVLHDINYAAAYADRIIALKAGRVVADGAPDAVVTAALLRDVFETPANVTTVARRQVVLV
ncbi:ATP-binding cassette domain-containing protein [Rhodobacteraceae bacterium B1Z28]|uniref:ATP-binding cassette domain-containing protein n=1 Tax=Ruegeria haliotis TaxID=2747601 RepID=A0ABX2PT57_9RHOB|nr:ATP-binding cassette domain-containing protein [Ruegeria haliotis]NVO56737.1 ATP-binding cassette domain-containing protein [Ruegeria haliotis]